MAAKKSADVVIVGSGIAGSQIAAKLAKRGINVVVLEAGPRGSRALYMENARNSPNKDDHQRPYPPAPYALHPQYTPDNGYFIQKGPHDYPAGYLRHVGGTTWHWAGMAWRITPNDMVMKSKYGIGRDWPLTYDELEPYYYESEVLMGVGGPNEGWFSPRSKPYPHPPMELSDYDKRIKAAIEPAGYRVIAEPAARNSSPFRGRPACIGNNHCMPLCPINAQYTGETAVQDAEEAGAVIMENSVVYGIEHDKNNKITAVQYKTPDGTSYRMTGKLFVLAANAIETSKLLLISTSSKFPNGIANSSDQVGRNLMDHPGTGVTFVAKEPVWAGRGPMVIACVPNYSDGEFRSDHASMKIDFNNIVPTRHATQYLLSKGYYGAELDKKIRDYTSRWVNISSMIDIPPDPNNRVLPSKDQKDVLGIPYPEVYYSIGSYVERGGEFVKNHFAKIAELMGGTEIVYTTRFANNNHIMGTLIMGNDPKDSVVDKDLKTHDHPNLYIASSGVMPSASTVNCTLTISALSLKLADTLINELKRG